MRASWAKQIVVVRGVADTNLPKAAARELYEDRTPPPTAEEVEMRRIERLFKATTTSKARPDRRNRQDMRRLRGKD